MWEPSAGQSTLTPVFIRHSLQESKFNFLCKVTEINLNLKKFSEPTHSNVLSLCLLFIQIDKLWIKNNPNNVLCSQNYQYGAPVYILHTQYSFVLSI